MPPLPLHALPPPLTWPTYFRLRLQKKRVQQFLALPAALATTTLVATKYQYNPYEPICGVDSNTIVAMGAVAMGYFGYLVGGMLGTLTWKIWKGKKNGYMDIVSLGF